MSQQTNIEWATSTGNPWIGCTKISPGCSRCYAATMDEQRFSKTMGGGTKENPVGHWGKGAPRVRTKAFWADALRWNRDLDICKCGLSRDRNDQCECGMVFPRPRIFPSLCDWLDDEVPIEWLADFLKLIHDTPNLDWLLLTKRPENFLRIAHIGHAGCATSPGMKFPKISQWADLWSKGKAPNNVWIGVSVEDQKRADERIPLLLQIPAKVRFLSVEPLLEKVNLGLIKYADWQCNYPEEVKPEKPRIHWGIVGGESGANRRDCGVEAICDVARQFESAGIPPFVKQDCAFKPGQQGRIPAEVWKLKAFPQ